MADAGQDVVQGPPRPRGIVHVVGRYHSGAQPLRQRGEPGNQPGVGRPVVALQLDPKILGPQDFAQPAGDLARFDLIPGQQRAGHRAFTAAREPDQSFSMRRQRFQGKPWLALLAGQLPGAEQPAQVGVPVLRLCQQHQVAAVDGVVARGLRVVPVAEFDGCRAWRPAGQGHLRPDDGLDPVRLGRLPETHGAVQAVVVGQGQRRIAQRGGLLDQRLRRRGAIQQREVAVAVKLDIRFVWAALNHTPWPGTTRPPAGRGRAGTKIRCGSSP